MLYLSNTNRQNILIKAEVPAWMAWFHIGHTRLYPTNNRLTQPTTSSRIACNKSSWNHWFQPVPWRRSAPFSQAIRAVPCLIKCLTATWLLTSFRKVINSLSWARSECKVCDMTRACCPNTGKITPSRTWPWIRNRRPQTSWTTTSLWGTTMATMG